MSHVCDHCGMALRNNLRLHIDRLHSQQTDVVDDAVHFD